MDRSVKKLVFSAMFLALGFVLPYLTGQIPELGAKLCPMHIPVLLCGFVCGWPYGLAVGLLTPLLRSLIVGMPPLFPTAVGMASELAVYGLMTGLLYRLLPKKIGYLYAELLLAMICGRAVWGLVRYLLAGLSNSEFPFEMFFAGAVTDAIPGILVQLALVPLIVAALRKARLIPDD